MTPDEIIEVLQGFKAGRGWQFLSTANEWKTPILSSLDSMLHALDSGLTIRLAPQPDEITLPARTIPAPLREAPKNGEMYYLASPTSLNWYYAYRWSGDESELFWLERGLVHSTAERAVIAAKSDAVRVPTEVAHVYF